MDTPTTAIGPGLGAFVAFFVLALLLWLLMRNMNGRMRRMAYAERDRVARLEAEDQAQATTEAGDLPPDATGPDHRERPDPRGGTDAPTEGP